MIHPDTVEALDALSPGTVILTGDGYAYQKNRGRWCAFFDKHGSTSATMLDPDHSQPPIRVIYEPAPGETGA